MNEKKICFIMCTNNELYENESIYYISKLRVPQGYEVEVLTVKDAESMCAGYNEAMKESDAKYKVYLHQDVFLIYEDFLIKLLQVFEEKEIGMFGLVGSNDIQDCAVMWFGNRSGKLYSNGVYVANTSEFDKIEGDYQEVMVIDGLLMATQYDILWREDIFKKWDFYDLAQSMEFWKKGYKVVVPATNKPWCIHDDGLLRMNHYYGQMDIFLKEYKEIIDQMTDQMTNTGNGLLCKDGLYWQEKVKRDGKFKKLKVLYYTWNEVTAEDCIESMHDLGFQVELIYGKMRSYDLDEVFMSNLSDICTYDSYDCIFSFNYFPLISEVANECKIPYISWVYDSPHPTLDSVTLTNQCNKVFLFDYSLYQMYRKKGVQTVYHMPLAYHQPRLENKIRRIPKHYSQDITFLGNLYDDKSNFFDQIKYLPPKLEGYINALIDAQMQVHGLDFCSIIFDHEKCEEMANYIKVYMGDKYMNGRDEVFRNMIRKKVTAIERRRLLNMVGQKYKVDLYSIEKPDNLPVIYRGYAEYRNQMPEIFYTSKINLNVTLRSILSGIPLRVIDILGAHGFLITNYQPEFSNYFENGKDIVWYEDTEDFMDKIEFYLSHDKERERIAHNGNKKAQEHFTYHHLLQKIFQFV